MGSPTLEVKEDLNQLKRWTVSTLFKRWVKEIGKATRALARRGHGRGRVETRRDVRRGRDVCVARPDVLRLECF